MRSKTAFAQLPLGRAIHRPRIDMYVPCQRDDGHFRWGTMEGTNGGFFAICMKSDIIHWPRDEEGNWTEEKYCREPGTYCGLILLISTENGEPLAIINDGALQYLRVGAGAALGAKHLSRADSGTVGMIGSGGMARTFLEGFITVRQIRPCKVFSPTKANREAYASEMSEKLDIVVVHVDTPEEAARAADILSTCTDSMVPVYEADWLEPGMHVTNFGRREMPEAAMPIFDVVFRQGTAGHQDEAVEALPGRARPFPRRLHRRNRRGDGPHPAAQPPARLRRRRPGIHRPWQGRRQARDRSPSQRHPNRAQSDQITFYRNVGNQGLQFSSIAPVVYKRALANGDGREIPTDWFVQDIRD